MPGDSDAMDYKAVLAACEDKQVGGAMADAVDKLFAKDHRNLKNDTGERAIADMLAVYLRPHFEGYDVNVEYNRMGDSPNEVTWRTESGAGPDKVFPRHHPRGRKPARTATSV